MVFRFSLIIISAVLLLLTGCAGRNTINAGLSGGDTLTHVAELLTITDFDGYRVVDIENPWRKDNLLQRYILIDRDKPQQAGLPDGLVIKTPLQSSLIYSSVHAGAIKELGAVKAITAVCDAQYFKIPEITEGLQAGRIFDMGSSMSPLIERIVEHEPEVILASPFQNAGHGAIEQLGIPIVECADYMESTPLGRAEWIKLLGELYGCRAEADSIFSAVSRNYNNMVKSVAIVDYRPVVISEMMTDGVWYVPGGNSYMACMFKDAGADYPWSDDKSTGSLQLDFATVYDRAHDADFWFIRTFEQNLTLDRLKSIYSLHSKIKAFKENGVYVSNTATSPMYEEYPFHPDMLLRDFINIMHPGRLSDETILYFNQIK